MGKLHYKMAQSPLCYLHELWPEAGSTYFVRLANIYKVNYGSEGIKCMN